MTIFWRDQKIGGLKPLVGAYLKGEALDQSQITALRGYLRQWIEAPERKGPVVVELRRQVPGLTTPAKLDAWMEQATNAGLNPL